MGKKVTAYNVYNDQNNYRFYDSVWDFFEKVMPDEKKSIVFYGELNTGCGAVPAGVQARA